ncbi:MAG: MFS transporter [bacterium]
MTTKVLKLLNGKNGYREQVNLYLFLSGKFISVFGSAIYAFAVGLYLLKTTGSGLTFAVNIVLYTIPMVLLNPVAGVIADRINKKFVVVGSDLLNGVFLIGVYFLIGGIGLSVPLVYISTFVITVLAIFFNIAIEAAKPNLVGKEKLMNINSLARVIESGSQVVAPMLGGLIYAFVDMRLFILFNALSFIIAALLEFFIDYSYNKGNTDTVWQEAEKREEDTEDNENQLIDDTHKRAGEAVDSKKTSLKKDIWPEMKEGYQYIFARQHMKAMVVIFTALNFIFSFSVTVPVPYLLNTSWQIDSTVYGIVQGGFPVGMIIGALLIQKLMARISYSKLLKKINYTICVGILGFAMPLLLFSTVPHLIFVLIYYTILMLISGVIVSWVDIPLMVLLQQIVPGKILGRVISVKLSIVKIIVPISLIFSGYLVNFLSPLYLFLSGAIVFVLFNLWFFRSNIGREFINISNRNLAEEDVA